MSDLTAIKRWEGEPIENTVPAKITIRSQKDADQWAEVKKELNNQVKEITKYFEPKKSKSRSVWQDWVQAEKDCSGPKLKAIDVITQAVRAFAIKREEALIAKAEVKAEKTGLPVEPVRVEVGGRKLREHYTITVVEPEKVPKQFWIIDEAYIQRWVNENKGAEVAGVKITKNLI